jgi:fibronectin-binding autotransporter adhesin
MKPRFFNSRIASFTLAAFALCAATANAQSGSQTWTGATDSNFYNGANWSGGVDFPNGNVTFSGTTANSNITRTGNSYNYVFGLFFTNTLDTQSSFTLASGGTGFNWGGPSIKTSTVTSGSLTDEIAVNLGIAGGNTGQATKVFDVGSFHNLVVSGNITGNLTSLSGTVTKNGAGTLLFTGTNSYTAPTTINAGILQYSKLVSMSVNAPLTVANGGTLGVNVGGADQWATGTSGVGTIGGLLSGLGGRSGGTVTYTGNVALGLDTSNAVGTQTYGAAIGNVGTTLGITKLGTGTLALSAANTYTGATTVSAGTLAVNGSLANTSTTIGTGATLQGSGSIGGSVTVEGGGTLASGNSIQSLATGALSLEALATFAYEIDNDAAANVAGDLTAVTGDLTFDLTNAAILTLMDLGAGSWAVDDKLTLISYSGSWNGGLFNYGGTLADDSTINFSGMDWMFNYDDTASGTNYTGDLTGSSFVTMTAIPEPNVAALLGGLGAMLLLRRRR